MGTCERAHVHTCTYAHTGVHMHTRNTTHGRHTCTHVCVSVHTHVYTQGPGHPCARRESRRRGCAGCRRSSLRNTPQEAHSYCGLRGHKTEVMLGQRSLVSDGAGLRGSRVRRREGQSEPSCRPRGFLPEFTEGWSGRWASAFAPGPHPQQPRAFQAVGARGHLPVPQGQGPSGLGKATALRPSGPTSWATAVSLAS